MAVSNTFLINKGSAQFVATDTAGGGARMVFQPGRYGAKMSAQRITGAGTYTIEGSNDGTNWGALSTAIAAKADGAMVTISDAPAFVGVSIAAAAATVVINCVAFSG